MAKSRHYEVLPQKCGALRARFKKGQKRLKGLKVKSENTLLPLLPFFALSAPNTKGTKES